MNEWKTLQEELPKENQVVFLKTISQSIYGVKLNGQYFILKDLRSTVCNCVTGHELVKIESKIIEKWRYPKDPELLNIIYEDSLK